MAAASAHGGRLLRDVETGNLQDLLDDFREMYYEAYGSRPSTLGIPTLEEIHVRHGTSQPLSATGPGPQNGLPLLYHMISIIVSTGGVIVVVDLDGLFDLTKLRCSWEDLMHVHILRATGSDGGLETALKGIEGFMLSGPHLSQSRHWAGTVVCGAIEADLSMMKHLVNQAKVIAVTGWRGWIRVELEAHDVVAFDIGVSAEEAMSEREKRREAVEGKGWRALSQWGNYSWQ